MLSSGGTASAATAARHASWTVLSGPAGRRGGRRADGRRSATRSGLDMGGTSCDVSLIVGRRAPRWAAAARSAGARSRCRWWTCTPSAPAAARSPGATRAARCAWGRARRAPTRARRATGAAASEPTVTDANLLLGHLDEDAPLAGGVRLDRAAAERAVGELAERARPRRSRRPPPASSRVASAAMAQAVRVVTVERGIDPRELALVPFGGAGPLHAAQIAGRARHAARARAGGERRAVRLRARGGRAPPRPGGERAADRRRPDAPRRSRAAVERLARARPRGAARGGAPPSRSCAPPTTCATRGRRSSCRSTASRAPDPEELRRAFDRAHEERYGYADPDADLELVTRARGGRAAGRRAAPGRVGRPSGRARSTARRWCALPGSTLVVPRGLARPRRGRLVVMER